MGKKVKFTKMHVCGNDYVYIYCTNEIIYILGLVQMVLFLYVRLMLLIFV